MHPQEPMMIMTYGVMVLMANQKEKEKKRI
jgi:hypothetical protein